MTERGEDPNHGFFQVLPDGEVGVFSTTLPPFRVEAMRMSTGERNVITEEEGESVPESGPGDSLGDTPPAKGPKAGVEK